MIGAVGDFPADRSFYIHFREKEVKKYMKYKIMTIAGLIGSGVATFFGGWGNFLYLTGLPEEFCFRQYLEEVRNQKTEH